MHGSIVDLSSEAAANDDTIDEILKQKDPTKVLAFILTGNETLKSIPLTIARFDHLKKLDLKNNSINEIHWSIVYLKKLEVLNLSQNAISIIPKTIEHLVSLQEFDISENPISYLPTELLSLHNLKSLDVSGCKYLISPTLEECTGSLAAIQELLKKRLGRQNAWEGDTAWYSKDSQMSMPSCSTVRSLQSCCIDVIVSCKIEFLQSQTVPPMIKNNLQKVESECQNSIKVSKCSYCSGYFSCVEQFNAHTCRRLKRT